ncbi:MAG: hypothetical protein WC817_04150 [Patescibacteria group bacterium]|jgi:hypothetical protein
MGKFKQVREAVEFQKETSAGQQSHDYYNLDRRDASEYFALLPKWREQITTYFQALHGSNEEVVHVDICGRATAEKLGADKSYCFSLKTPESRRVVRPNDVFIDGDIFSNADFSNLLERLKQENVAPALVTFEPVVGLQSYDPRLNLKHNPRYREVVYGQLEKRLRAAVAILKPGGYVFLERPFQSDGTADFFQGKPQKKWEISLAVKKLARELHCSIEIASEITGPYFLIHKPLSEE